MARVKEAVAEVRRVAATEPLIAAEVAVAFIERLSPAIEQVDGSSGSMGTAVNNAIAALVPIIACAPVDTPTRQAWLERLYAAYEADEIPYIESLGDHWGSLCASPEVAEVWADRLIETVKVAWSQGANTSSYFAGTPNCLSALVVAERYDEVLALLERAPYRTWHYRQYGKRAQLAQGRKAEALRYVEEGRGVNDSPSAVARALEEILLCSGLVEDA